MGARTLASRLASGPFAAVAAGEPPHAEPKQGASATNAPTIANKRAEITRPPLGDRAL
jgi:hypothetical protein